MRIGLAKLFFGRHCLGALPGKFAWEDNDESRKEGREREKRATGKKNNRVFSFCFCLTLDISNLDETT